MRRCAWVLGLVLVGCGTPPPVDAELSCADAGTATLAAGAQTVLTAKCVSCHITDYTYGDYTSAAKSALMVNQKSAYAGTPGSLKIVDPGHLENSSLWLKVLGGAQRGRTGPKNENVQGAMPNDGTALTPNEKQTLKAWICSGAQ
ncbi:MAG: hypothetical protein U0228_27860 [Myxococcaceae bacterium]